MSTAVVSIWTWGFNSFGQAFFIMNFFHAFQYFAIVWWSEKKNLAGRLKLAGRKRGLAVTLVLFLVPQSGTLCTIPPTALPCHAQTKAPTSVGRHK